ncbi:CobD/CbiB family cobalamin biosynthesis protein, partial [Klebsiella quasipneumoniae]|uniref:CobD/CbiB family cobalamin biosynthesis protein n=1 Tax=Klebsiella quasipneumoniae TaxID=1463165 RepID=UPI001E5C5829
LSWIVGRDTTQLQPQQINRAVVETVAENTVDGIIAPLFFLLLGGAPLAMAYKAVNTLDSMVGYKHEKYRAIGMVSARLDDVANFIPARLSWLLIILAAV